MDLTPKQILKIAELAKLSIKEEEMSSIKNKLNNILHFVEKMSEVDTRQVQPLAHSFDAPQPLREDQVTEINQRELFQKNAPQTSAGLYIVPKVIES